MNFLTELVNEGFGWEEKDGGLVMYTTNKGKRILSILLLCALCVTGIIADSGLQKIQVKAAQETYKVLIWSTVIRDTDGFYQVNFEALVDKYAVQLQSEEAAIDVTLKYSYSQLRPEHFDGTETLADDYDLIWVYLPYMTPNENDIPADYINTDSDLLGGKDLDGNNLTFKWFGNITYQEPAEVVASYHDIVGIVDQAVDKGRITVLSDMDVWKTFWNESSKDLLMRFLLNSKSNKEKVENGENSNEGFGQACQLQGEIAALGKTWTGWTDSEEVLSSQKDVEVTMAGSDMTCGLQSIAYYLSSEKLSEEQLGALTEEQWKELTVTDGKGSFTLSQEGSTIIYGKTVDAKGNVCYLASDVFQLDKTPIITPTPTVAPTATPTIPPTATPKITPTVTLTATPENTPTAMPTATPENMPTVMPTATPTIVLTETPAITPPTEPTVTPLPVQKDTTPPVGKILVEKDNWTTYQDEISFSHFYKTAVKVRIEANDEESGVQTISYYVGDKALKISELSGLKWRTYVSWFSLYPDMRGIIYVKIQDADGYIVYGNRCNTKGHVYKMKKLKTISKQNITKWNHKKL